MTTATMTRADVTRIIREARARGENPDLSGRDLRGVNFRYMNLMQVDFSGADLRGADFYCANLHDADLSHADLSGANMSWVYLHGAIMHQVNMYGADAMGIYLGEADLSEVVGIVDLGHTPSGRAWMVPTRYGTWAIAVDRWSIGTIDNLRTLIASGDWPKITGCEPDPTFPALAATADAQAAHHADWLDAVVERWGHTG